MKNYHRYLLLLQLFSVCFLWGQTKKTVLLPQDYGLWGILGSATLSPEADYVSYQTVYPYLSDTLFVKTQQGKTILSIPKGHSGLFIKDNYYGCFTGENTYQIINLITGAKKVYDSIYYVKSIKGGNQILMVTVPEQESSTIKILKYDGTLLASLPNTTAFKESPDTNRILLVQRENSEHVINLFDCSTNKTLVKEINRSTNTFLNPIWQSNSKKFVYLEKVPSSKKIKIHVYDTENQKTKNLEFNDQAAFNNLSFQGYNSLNMSFSEDGYRLFFYLSQDEILNKTEDETIVEVWNAADKQDYANKMRFGLNGNGKLGTWELKENTVSVIGEKDESVYRLNGNQKFAVTESNSKYLPTTKQKANKDYHVYNLSSGKNELFIPNQDINSQELYFSPDGSAVVYVKDEQWYIYYFAKMQHFHLAQINSTFMTPSTNNSQLLPFGVAGWSIDGTAIFVYDQYDLWKIEIHKGTAIRLTKGREEKITYRIVEDRKPVEATWFTPEVSVINLKKELLLSLSSVENHKSGIAILNPNQTSKIIIYEGKNCTEISYNQIAQKVIFKREDFNLPPQIAVADVVSDKIQLVFQSNPQHFNYNWGKSELVKYQNSKGDFLQGALYYPFNYEKGKKYPLVVQIYERQSSLVHKYIYPSYYNNVGFNTANLTGDGYFVLQPDITYEIGNPGFSALDCVEAAVKSTIEKEVIDINKIGLIGQSFGGYETFFITSQSKLFATGIAGAGISDMSSMYLTFGTDEALPDLWRFEHQQLRMGQSLFENPEAYKKNSPLNYAETFSIPLLTWTGTDDHAVAPEQTMKWYIAMRRLSKNHIMLRYPNQGHTLFNPSQQKDLTLKIQQWFGHYLKGDNEKYWMLVE